MNLQQEPNWVMLIQQRLKDIIQTHMSIKVEWKTKRRNTYELQVGAIIALLPTYTLDVERAFTIFNNDIKDLPRLSTAHPADLYKAVMAEDNKSFTVWHRTSTGDLDRQVAVISDDPLRPASEMTAAERSQIFFDKWINGDE